MGEVGLRGGGLIGLEKLMLLLRPTSVLSAFSISSFTLDKRLAFRLVVGGEVGRRLSMLMARPLPRPFGVGEVTRGCGSTLDDLLPERVRGMAGTGGASRAWGTGASLPGEGDRKVRSVIEEELPLRCIAGLPPPTTLPLPMED